jgi:hypothetical protein
MDVREFIEEYFGACRGTDEDRIMSYYAEQICLRSAPVKVPGCSVYEFDPASRRITAGRIYFDLGTLMRQIAAD